MIPIPVAKKKLILSYLTKTFQSFKWKKFAADIKVEAMIIVDACHPLSLTHIPHNNEFSDKVFADKTGAESDDDK